MSIVYYMQKGGEGVQIACKIAYVLNGSSRGLCQRAQVNFGPTLKCCEYRNPSEKVTYHVLNFAKTGHSHQRINVVPVETPRS